jgi:hypothetical protein
MPVFESTSSDIYDTDVSEDIFRLPSTNRHRMLTGTTESSPFSRYIWLMIQSEILLEQLRAIRVLRAALTGWVHAAPAAPPALPAPETPIAPAPEEAESNEAHQIMSAGEGSSEPIAIEDLSASGEETNLEQGDETQQNLDLKALGFGEEEESDSQSD